METQYFWLLDGETQQYFKFYYQPGLENLVDYPSKHHTANIHQHVQPYYVYMDNFPMLLPRTMEPSTRQGCAEILGDPYSKKSPLPSVGTSPHLANGVCQCGSKKVMLITLSKGYFCTNFYIRWSCDITSPSTTTQETTNKHHHHGDGAACPSSGVDSMIPRHLRGGRPCPCCFQGRR
jgi:hypothetical protein